MNDPPHVHGKALSLMIVWLIAISGAFALLAALPAPAHAATCDQGGSLISGDWTISTTEVCQGIEYTVDGSVTVTSGGSLTLVNGGLSFAKDAKHTGYSLTVNTGGTLILDHSIVTVQTTMIQPYLKLAFTVTGPGATFAMVNESTLKFPGWFNATGATITLTDSLITGFQPGEISSLGVYVGDNDNSPLIAWSSTTASLYRSRIDRIYENMSASGATNVTGPVEGNITLTSSSTLYTYDSYIGVDYSNVIGLHNELQVDGTSNAYLYNVTIDRSEDPVLETNWRPALVPLAAGGNIYLLRWLEATVLDSTGFPVSGARISAVLSPAATPAQYPDNGLLTTPSAGTLAYLQRTASTWNVTDFNGQVQMPLFTDQITTTSLPNANSFGNYQVTASYGTVSVSSGVDFNPYPALSVQDNNIAIAMPMSSVTVRQGPDLALHQSDYPGTDSVLVGQAFHVYALIWNQGQSTATGVSIAAFLDSNRSDQVARVDGLTVQPTVSPVQPVNVTLNVSAISTPGAHTLELIVNPDNTINEGGTLQRSNNFANITLNVLPPPPGFIAIQVPVEDASVEPGTNLVVSGVVRDLTTSANPIPGVALTISLMSGTSSIASTTVTTDTTGVFMGTLSVPSGTADGAYTVSVTSSVTTIQSDSRAISIRAPAPFLNTPVPLLGIPWWLFLIILAVIVVAAVGMTLYFKVYGLGKMVECGECGSFIPEDATVCPKCGVEFEKDMAKCSNCGSWIPVDVKQCPECGVEFATGQLDMADYQERMRLQYDEVVRKLREDANRQLGRALSDQEFQEWWRRQPSFLTFEDWLAEEEEMRKQGSKPCPVCGTLNSVTAKVCHKCGSFMRPAAAPVATGAVKVSAPKRVARPAGSAAPSAAETEEPLQAAGPVVQKRVVKKTPAEGEPTQTQDESQENQDL